MNVIVVIGAGSIGQAIARRVGAGMDSELTASYRFGDLAPKLSPKAPNTPSNCTKNGGLARN